MNKAVAGIAVAGGVAALTAAFSDTVVSGDRAHCRLGGDYYASIVETNTGKVLVSDNIAVNGNRCTIDAGNELVHYTVR